MSTLPDGATIGNCATCGGTTYTEQGGAPTHKGGSLCPGPRRTRQPAVPDRCASGGWL